MRGAEGRMNQKERVTGRIRRVRSRRGCRINRNERSRGQDESEGEGHIQGSMIRIRSRKGCRMNRNERSRGQDE
jgi:hypothetical protein